jgi:hypothetical protein
MRGPDNVLDQLRTKYRKNWRDWLLSNGDGPFSFALSAPSAQAIAHESDLVGRWLRSWREWAEGHPTAALRRATRRTIVGDQEMFTHLDVQSVGDLVALDKDVAGHWSLANARWTRLRPTPGGAAQEPLRPHLQQIVDLDHADFEILLDATEWFLANPRSGLTVRQVQVLGMHTKWLARNRRLVMACLNIVQRTDASDTGSDEDLEQGELDALGLRALPVHVDLILADPADRARVGGLRHLNAPLPEINALPVCPDTVLIVENKESALLVPDHPRTVVIHSLGNRLNVLDDIRWLDSARCLYWGDLDRAGFTLLSRARARLPRLTSFMMDLDTIDDHKSLAVRDVTRADPPDPNLTEAETVALAALSTRHGSHLRLEQERLAPSFALERLRRALVERPSAGS